MNPFLYGYWPGGFQGGQGYVGDDPNAAAAKLKMIAAGASPEAVGLQVPPAVAMLGPQLAAQFGPFAAQAAAQMGPRGPQVPVHPAAYGRMPPPWWVSNTGSAPFDPRDFAGSLPSKVSPMVLPLGTVTIAAGVTGTLQATVQRAIVFKKVILVGTGATDLQSADIVSFTCNGDNLTAGGGVFPATTYDKLDEFDNMTSDLYTSGAVVSITLLNTSGAAITIRGSIRGDTAR